MQYPIYEHYCNFTYVFLRNCTMEIIIYYFYNSVFYLHQVPKSLNVNEYTIIALKEFRFNMSEFVDCRTQKNTGSLNICNADLLIVNKSTGFSTTLQDKVKISYIAVMAGFANWPAAKK